MTAPGTAAFRASGRGTVNADGMVANPALLRTERGHAPPCPAGSVHVAMEPSTAVGVAPAHAHAPTVIVRGERRPVPATEYAEYSNACVIMFIYVCTWVYACAYEHMYTYACVCSHECYS